jgi:hypothetical protein
MTAGILQLMGGSLNAVEGDFTYDDADWQDPIIEYSIDDAGKGYITLDQKATGRPAMRPGQCEWAIRLNQDLPLELNVRFGAGKANLKLAGLLLTRLNVESGVGELELDLTGDWRESLQAYIRTGIGDVNLRVPHNVGLRISSAIGFGSVRSDFLERDGEIYTNAQFGQSPANLDIRVEGGMGKINIE